jgi:hypothetical protein
MLVRRAGIEQVLQPEGPAFGVAPTNTAPHRRALNP